MADLRQRLERAARRHRALAHEYIRRAAQAEGFLEWTAAARLARHHTLAAQQAREAARRCEEVRPIVDHAQAARAYADAGLYVLAKGHQLLAGPPRVV